MTQKIKQEFILDNDPYYKMSKIDTDNYETEFWDVSETIKELSYLTHSYFRYYGKFPSKIGKLILDDLISREKIDNKKDFILDNYAGSGTTLVEAKLKNYDSFGIDINPFAVLACKVKTANYDVSLLKDYWSELYNEISLYNSILLSNENTLLSFTEPNKNDYNEILSEIEKFKTTNKDGTKWFLPKAITGLSIIKHLLLKRPKTCERDFFSLAFFAIIRRVSTAFDGEVRPHVNKNKKQRNVAEAYEKKVLEMIDIMNDWNNITQKDVISDTILCNNATSDDVDNYINDLKNKTGKELGLVVSHPPYLNCFDYIPVFKLKFMWANGFDDIFYGYTYKDIKSMEIKSYPANSTESIERYFEHNKQVYENVYNNLKSGGYCCVVIGDCTLQKKLFAVHKTFVSMLEEIGFITEKIAYRSTSYGIGQYAYKHRADYSEYKDRKQDGVLFFRKP
ncbi:MAG: site-specific DNA-methyltransferase [Lactobacillus sp.]|nr:site-specific DNA-methyltransferase [Lactobacillus sp.]